MKIHGKKIENPNREIIVIPRGDREDIVLIAEAVLDHKPFNKLCPIPEPRTQIKDGMKLPDLKDPKYQKRVQKYGEMKTTWLVLSALKATPGLEWDMVDPDDASTWKYFRKELTESGFNEIEINAIVNGALSAQGLNEARIQAAREDFLLSLQARKRGSSSLVEGLNSMLSGEPAKDSD